MSVASIMLAPTREFFGWLGSGIARRFMRVIGGAMIFLVIGTVLYVHSFIDRSLNYVAVDAVTRSVERECQARREVRRSGGLTTEHLPGGWTCERLRALVETDPGYRSYTVTETVFAEVVYRSPVDKALYLGRIELGHEYRTMPVAEGTPIRILASTGTPGMISTCCDNRVDWLDGSAADL